MKFDFNPEYTDERLMLVLKYADNDRDILESAMHKAFDEHEANKDLPVRFTTIVKIVDRMMKRKNTPQRWAMLHDLTILDYDGWRVDKKDIHEEISFDEFQKRLMVSTIMMKKINELKEKKDN